jgi:WD40 repeat protein
VGRGHPAAGTRHRRRFPLTPIRTIAFSPDSTTLVAAIQSDGAQVFDVATGRLIKNITGYEDWVQCASFSPDGTAIATGSQDGTARIWGTPRP